MYLMQHEYVESFPLLQIHNPNMLLLSNIIVECVNVRVQYIIGIGVNLRFCKCVMLIILQYLDQRFDFVISTKC